MLMSSNLMSTSSADIDTSSGSPPQLLRLLLPASLLSLHVIPKSVICQVYVLIKTITSHFQRKTKFFWSSAAKQEQKQK